MDENTQGYKVGDTIKVLQKITEGKKQRTVTFKGQLIRIKGKDKNIMLTVRQLLDGIYVDRIYPTFSPTISSIQFVAHPKNRTRRAKLLKLPTKK